MPEVPRLLGQSVPLQGSSPPSPVPWKVGGWLRMPGRWGIDGEGSEGAEMSLCCPRRWPFTCIQWWLCAFWASPPHDPQPASPPWGLGRGSCEDPSCLFQFLVAPVTPWITASSLQPLPLLSCDLSLSVCVCVLTSYKDTSHWN